MSNEQIVSILYYLKDFSEEKLVGIGVDEAIAMFEACDTYDECKKWIHEEI